MKKLFILLVAMLSLNANAQSVVKDFPDDLARVKIVFLEFETLAINDNLHSIIKRDYTWRNKNFEKNNKSLREEVKDYPFGYGISTRAEYRNWVAGGYKYVLESDILEAYNNGLQTRGGGTIKYTSQVYLKDLVTGTRYELFTIMEGDVLRYGWIISKFNEKVRKNYKIK